MAEKKSTQQQRKLEQMSKEALEAIIREDCSTPGVYEESYIDAVLEELVRRARQEGKTRTEEELKQIWKQILKEAKRSKAKDTVQKIRAWALGDEKRKSNRTGHGWLRAGAVAAVLALLILLVPPVSGAESLFRIITNWAENVFTISSSGKLPAVTEPTDGILYNDNNEGLTQLREELRKYGVTEQVVPTWIPEEFELSSINIEKSNDGIYVASGIFKCEEKSLIFHFLIGSTKSSINGEWDNTTSEKYMCESILHYIISNNFETQCFWINGNVQCRLNGDVSKIEAHTILNSIYAGQEEDG